MQWDFVVMMLAVYNCLQIPFQVAFEPDSSVGFYAWERVVDVLFFLDVILAFRTTYINEKTGFEVYDNRIVALNYIKSGRFFIDIAASIPWEIFLQAIDPSASGK